MSRSRISKKSLRLEKFICPVCHKPMRLPIFSDGAVYRDGAYRHPYDCKPDARRASAAPSGTGPMARADGLPPESEAQFQRWVTDCASRMGWSWGHVQKSRVGTKDVWMTAMVGPLGKGWPDLILVRGERVIAAELKKKGGQPTEAQTFVGHLLALAGVPVYVWRPSDRDAIEATLR
jgi:hypothetical protein